MDSFPTSRNPLLSLLQSAAASLHRLQPGAIRRDVDTLIGKRPNPRAAYAGPSATPQAAADCAGLGLQLLRAWVDGDRARHAELEKRIMFSACDPGWAEVLIDYARRFLPTGTAEPIPYRRWTKLDDFIVPAPSASLRIGLLSDWGTGTDEARAVAALMAKQRPDIVIHLGDIYYAGTSEECDEHFLKPLRAEMPAARVFALCGNHDIYSGGHGYYELLDKIGQPASYFCLRAPDNSWQILAADTGLNDRDPLTEDTAPTFLDPAEIEWQADKLKGFPGRTILLTHHQPFSAYAQIGAAALHDPVNPLLMETHARLSAVGPIDAWVWGHEHSLWLYGPYRGVARGRNIGFGAIPVGASVAPKSPIAGLIDPPPLAADIKLDIVDGAYTHGFALLDLGPGSAEASYWAVTRPDEPLYRESL